MPNEITIRFASQADKENALRQIRIAKQRRAKGYNLGLMGMESLTGTLERAKSIETQDHSELIAISKTCKKYLADKVKLDGYELAHAIQNFINIKLEPTTKKV